MKNTRLVVIVHLLIQGYSIFAMNVPNLREIAGREIIKSNLYSEVEIPELARYLGFLYCYDHLSDSLKYLMQDYPLKAVVQGKGLHLSTIKCHVFINPSLVAVADRGGILSFWDSDHFIFLAKIQTEQHNIQRIAVHPDKTQLVTTAGTGVKFWCIDTRALIFELHHDAGVYSVAFSSDGLQLVVGGYGGKIWIWDLIQNSEPCLTKEFFHFIQEETDKKSINRVFDVQFSKDAQKLISAASHSLKVWDLKNDLCEKEVPHNAYLKIFCGATLLDDFMLLNCFVDGTLCFTDFKNDNVLSVEYRVDTSLTACAVSKDRRFLVTSSINNTMHLWEFDAEKKIWCNVREFQANAWVTQLTFNSTGDTILVGDISGGLVVLSIKPKCQNLTVLQAKKELFHLNPQ